MIIIFTGSSAHSNNVCSSSLLEAPYLESIEDKENNTLQIIGGCLTIIVDFMYNQISYLFQYLCGLIYGQMRSELS